MARLFFTGFEIDPVNGVNNTDPDGAGAGAARTRDTTLFRSGLSSARCNSGAGNSSSSKIIATTGSMAASTSYYYQCYLCFTQLPSSTIVVFDVGTGSQFSARLTSAGKLQFFNDNTATQIGSDSAATITADGATWYQIAILLTMDGSTQISDCELRLDGVTVASTSGLTLGLSSTTTRMGWVAAPGASRVVNVDDAIINDSTGAANNTWPGNCKVLLMKPVSDNNRGAWTQGAGVGGTTNLFDAVNNTPPVGVADASATATTQIKNRTATNPSSCDLNLNSYTTEGVGASDTINAIKVWCNDGEDPATGTKAGSCSMVSNPVMAAVNFPNFGDDVGTQGTYVGNWRWHGTAISQAPSVTKGTQPVIRVTCTSGATSARSASCDFLGAYVDYTPAVATFIEADFIKEMQAVNRSSSY